MQLSEKKIGIISKIMLFTATVIWGSSFFIIISLAKAGRHRPSGLIGPFVRNGIFYSVTHKKSPAKERFKLPAALEHIS